MNSLARFIMSASVLSVVVRTKTKRVTGQDENDGSSIGSSLDKAQLRRAQVRKAQIQHRQRKANYTKKLEMDIAEIRDLIASAQREAQLLKRENEAMKTKMHQLPLPPPPPPASSSASPGDAPISLFGADEVDFSYSIGLEDITMTLCFDEVINAPSFCISSSPSDSQFGSSSSQSVSPALPDATPDQTQEAINFILSYVSLSRRGYF